MNELYTGTGSRSLGPAGRVTLVRAVLAVVVAVLTVYSSWHAISVPTLVTITVVALVLDAVDGWVARHTGTVTALGARFDMEVDAFLIAVLSVYVARSVGLWVLAIGAARYLFGAATWVLPWLRGVTPPRYWAKVVAATQGIVLTVAAADVLPRTVVVVALLGALALLAESFGRQTLWLWRHRSAEQVPTVVPAWRLAAGRLLTGVAVLLVWSALVAPTRLHQLTPAAFVRVPVEGLVIVAFMLAVPQRAQRAVAAVVGVALALLVFLKALDIGFYEALGRPFNPIYDRSYFGSAEGLLGDSVGHREATVIVVAAIVLIVVLLVVMPLAVIRVTRVAGRRRAASLRVVGALAVVWAVCAVAGIRLAPDGPVASTSAFALVRGQVSQVGASLRDEQQFRKTASEDALRTAPAADLLTGLRGKDVLVVFVESYGRVAVQDSFFSPHVDSVLDEGTNALHADGFSAKSAFLTSPTFGGISWLAHSTLQSGVWVNNQARYDDVVGSDRFTLSDAFKRAGWRTVGDVPSNVRPWPQGTSFYHYDQLYDAHNVGYNGPTFSYAQMPDQFTLAAFQRNELSKPSRAPVMAEIDLVSSHTPWAPLPHLVKWSDVGDGSVYDGMPSQGDTPAKVWGSASRVQAAYGQSIEYSMSTLVSFVHQSQDPNLVLVVLGDHQPAATVSGQNAGHDVPISIIARDPAVLSQISGWGWQDGLRPHADAVVWPMDAFRDRFIAAYSPRLDSREALSAHSAH